LDRIKFSNRFFGAKSPAVCIWTLILLLAIPAVSAPKSGGQHSVETDKRKILILGGIARNWIQVGVEQHRRAFYKQAEKSFLEAQHWQQYLTDAEIEKLSKLLESTHAAVLERKQILGHIETADELIKEGEPIKAKAHLEKVKGSRFLTWHEQKQAMERIKGIDNHLDRRKKAIADLYHRSVALYRTGQSTGQLRALEEARKGFLEVARSGLSDVMPPITAEDYLVKIDDILSLRAQLSLSMEKKSDNKLPKIYFEPVKDVAADVVTEPVRKSKPEPKTTAGLRKVKQVNESATAIVDVADPLTKQNGHINKTADHKRNIRRSYARAVVEDAIAKVQNHVNEGRFYKAKQALATAKQTLNRNHSHIGDSSFNKYHSQLKRLAEQVARGRARWLGKGD
jgi:soluble cytochrome b562